MLITLIHYHNDYIIERERINRFDKSGLKQGTWKFFYPSDKLHIEGYYVDNVLDGLYKEYDENGNLITTLRYKNGSLVQDTAEFKSNIKIQNKFNEDGDLVYSGAYNGNVPVGIHRIFENGEVKEAIVYNDNGIVISKGVIDEQGIRKGKWRNFYVTGELKSEGEYQNNSRVGNWKFYYGNARIEQNGNYKNGKPDGLWTWYYPDGNVLREEEFYNGLEDGYYTEFDSLGNIITKGEYLEGEKEGEWYYKVGDHTENGKYVLGLRDEVWKYYYDNGVLQFEGNYVQGVPDGRHKVYYDNGVLKEERFYSMGIKDRNWKKYNNDGSLVMIITFQDDIEYRINGIKIDLEEDRKVIK